ncbi:hypothetical protein [Ralstonia mannitolilytica]|uniref:hypothetical protein n=1 Tax=Ralstonia mannitolilytica TaxID=105219 RepID=UPI0028F5B85E|nr:hypothetical protein [Ralstonia mannitolilytica]CAJ0740857.1 hypothetical protein R76696_03175 [Ralstonia mannitolilytica]
MKNVYARLVLWLIRPAIERHLDERGNATALRSPEWELAKDGRIRLTRDEACR